MSQPKNRRRAARRRARALRAKGSGIYVHLDLSGELRNPVGKIAPLDKVICVGLGSAEALRDGEIYENGDDPKRRSLVNRKGFVTLRRVEKHIKRTGQGRRQWAASIQAPLWDATWERQRPGKWVCTQAEQGFA